MSELVPISYSGAAVDFSTRYAETTAVVASPALAAETIIAQVAIPNNVQVMLGVRLTGWASFTAGTSGTTAQLRIRRASVSGTVVVAGPAEAVTAAGVYSKTLPAFDATVLTGTLYVLTLTVANGAAPSTVAAVLLDALPI